MRRQMEIGAGLPTRLTISRNSSLSRLLDQVGGVVRRERAQPGTALVVGHREDKLYRVVGRHSLLPGLALPSKPPDQPDGRSVLFLLEQARRFRQEKRMIREIPSVFDPHLEAVDELISSG